MTVLNQIVPGKVVNNGIRDESIPDYTPAQPTRPLHLPVISLVTPKGGLADDVGTVWIPVSDIPNMFGNLTNPNSPFYNPTTLLIEQLRRGNQHSVGIRRLSANKKVARTSLSAFVQRVTVQDYERDPSGRFKRNENGQRIPTGETFDGLSIVIKPDPEAANKNVGELSRRTIAAIPAQGDQEAVPETQVFPLFEAIAGVGDEYNKSGMNIGVRNDVMNYRSITDFMKATGVYPFELKMFTENDNGLRSYIRTVQSTEASTFTLFKAERNAVQYSVKHGFGNFTGTNQNRKTVARQAPYNNVHVYDDSINALFQTLYVVEREVNDTLLELNDYPFKQMNPFTLVNHTGVPYYALIQGDFTVWDMSGSLRATGGISPFLTEEGKLPSYVTVEEQDDPFGLLANVKTPVTPQQGWEINNELLAIDLNTYIDSVEVKNYTKNRQSFFWDVGYHQKVKDIAERLLGGRKDIIVMPDAVVWKQGEANLVSEVYSRFSQLSNSVKLYPESDKHGTPTCRASINTIQAKLTDERTSDYFSGNLDLAYAFALFAGNQEGVIRPAFSPDSENNRTLRTMHSPLVEFEEDFVAGENFNGGGITLRTKDVDTLFRPALVTVYTNPDSVLKDLVTTFLCVCIEKIAQDEWNELCGDTSKSAEQYVALFKDNAERKCRDRLGGLARQITFVPTYNETTPGGRAVLNVTGHAYFNKGKYMMNLDLYAYNETDLETSA